MECFNNIEIQQFGEEAPTSLYDVEFDLGYVNQDREIEKVKTAAKQDHFTGTVTLRSNHNHVILDFLEGELESVIGETI